MDDRVREHAEVLVDWSARIEDGENVVCVAEGTETAGLKETTLENMQDLFGYSAASAELTSRHVMGQVSYRWD